MVFSLVAGEAPTAVSVLSSAETPPALAEDVLAFLDALAPITVIVPDLEVVRRAVQAKSVYGVHFYDGMIIAAAERGGCYRIWSEDLNPGQDYFGVVVDNPFL